MNIKKLWPALLVIYLLLVSLVARAEQEISPEMVRASFILQLQKFVKFGTPPHNLKKICYYEKTDVPLDESVGQLIARHVSKHPGDNYLPSVQKFEAIGSFSGCDILFIPASEEKNIDNILTALGSASTLTISPAKRFIYRGGMIGFLLDNENHVEMEANTKNIKEKNIWIDPSLLEIMRHVEQR